MKITKKQLKRIIKEEKTKLLEYLDDVGGDKGAHVVDYLRTQARSYHNAGRDLDVDGDGVPDVSAIKTLLQDDFMDNFGHEFDIVDFGYEISNFANGAGLQESKKTKITKNQLKRIIREAIDPREFEEPLGGWVGDALHNDPDYRHHTDTDTIQTYVDKHIDDFVDAYITRASGGSDRFLEWWEMVHCEENGIPCTQDHLAALVDRAEQMGEVEEGELFVGLRGT